MLAVLHSKKGAAGLSIASNICLVILKLVVGMLTGSVSIMSEAIHSAIDLLAALIAFVSVRISDIPPDDDHPYGHGKIENISGTVEAILIFLGAGFIIYEAVHRIVEGSQLEYVALGAGVMGVSAIVNAFISRFLMRVASKTDSLALEADAWHLNADVLTSAGVFLALLVVWMTGLNFLDPLIAIGVALFICKAAYDLTKRSSSGLLDAKLPHEEENKIRSILVAHCASFVNFHSLRSRKAGSRRHVDLHLVMEDQTNIVQAHEICDHLEQEIESTLPNTDVTIHVEPASVDKAAS
ncbi:MAG: cation transporter [Chloroflexi bacterium]|nr:cation transporter [Chloroflexota bacterium]